MAEVGDQRRIECPECGAEVVLLLQQDFSAPDVRCGRCGEQITDNKLARSLGQNLSLEEAARAWALAREYTYAQIINLARKGVDNPDSLTPRERDTLLASVRLRAAGLPSHGDPKAN